MGYEETVMSRDEQFKLSPEGAREILCIKQAEISYKAGIKYGLWLFAWWKDGEQYVGTCGKTLKEADKEVRGIE